MNGEKYEVVKFVDNELELEVNVSSEEETIWMTQEEISQLFGKARSTITEHVNSIYKTYELDEDLTCRKNRRVQYEGNRKIGKTELSNVKTKPICLYNLDLVLAVGYRVNSKKGIEFRKWVNKVLKERVKKWMNQSTKQLNLLMMN